MILVVGGQRRKIGKTSVVTGLISSVASADWTAVKVTHHHAGSGYSLEREESLEGDSGRYLAAGARESWYLRAAPENLALAIPALRRILDTAANAIVESTSIVDYLEPDLYLLVLDAACPAIKESALRNLHRAGGFVLIGDDSIELPWSLGDARRFYVQPPGYTSPQLIGFVAERIRQESGSATRRENPPSG